MKHLITLSEHLVNEGMNKNQIKKILKIIDKQIDTETGGDGEALDNETLLALEQERERLESTIESVTEEVNDEMANESIVNEARASAVRLLKDVVKGSTSSVEGIKLSKDMAQAYLDWISGSTYGKKFGALPWNKLFDASFNWGIERYAKGKLKGELKELKAKAKEMSESVNEAKTIKGKDAGNWVKGASKGQTITINKITYTCLGKGKWIEGRDNTKVDWIFVASKASALGDKTVVYESKLYEKINTRVHIQNALDALAGMSSGEEITDEFINNLPKEYDVTVDQLDSLLDDAMGLRYEDYQDFAKNALSKDVKALAKGLSKYYVDESIVNEKLTRGLKPLLKLGLDITKKAGEDALIDLSDKFDELGDEQADNIASHLNMAIELHQDGYLGDATKKLKQFNKVCKDALSGKEVGSAFESVVNEAEKGSEEKENREKLKKYAEKIGKAGDAADKARENAKKAEEKKDPEAEAVARIQLQKANAQAIIAKSDARLFKHKLQKEKKKNEGKVHESYTSFLNETNKK